MGPSILPAKRTLETLAELGPESGERGRPAGEDRGKPEEAEGNEEGEKKRPDRGRAWGQDTEQQSRREHGLQGRETRFRAHALPPTSQATLERGFSSLSLSLCLWILDPEARQALGAWHIAPSRKMAALTSTAVVWSVSRVRPVGSQAWGDPRRLRSLALL